MDDKLLIRGIHILDDYLRRNHKLLFEDEETCLVNTDETEIMGDNTLLGLIIKLGSSTMCNSTVE